MNISELIFYGGLNRFLNTNDNLVKFNKKIGNSYIISLNLYQKEISYIRNNYEEFKKVLETILYTFNHSYGIYYSNITFNSIKFGNKLINNCIFLYSSENKDYGFVETNKFIEYNIPIQKQSFIGTTLYNKIGILIEHKQLSVRKLIKLGIPQIKARKLFDFLKEKEVFIISIDNQTHKTYDIEKYKFLGEKTINNIILDSV